MRLKRSVALGLASIMAFSAVGCSSKTSEETAQVQSGQQAEGQSGGQSGEEQTEGAAADYSEIYADGTLKEVTFPEELNNGEPCTIRFGWWGGQERHERTEAVVKMFMEKYPNVTIETEPSDFNGYFQKLPTLVAANDVWDVFQLGNGWAEFDSVIADLNPYIESGAINVDNISDAFLATTQANGKQMEISLGTNAYCIIYNADMFAEAGLEEPAENWTWKDFEEYAEALKEVTGDYGVSLLEELYLVCTLGVPQSEKGMNFFKEDNSGLMIENPDYMVPFIEMIQRMTESGAYPDRGALNEMGQAPEQNFVATGEAAMTWAVSNQVVAMTKAAEENGVGTLKVATIPRVTEDGPSGYAVKSSQGLAMCSKTEYPDVCATFINFFINSPEANLILMGERGVPVSAVVREVIEPSLSDQEKDIYEYVGNVGSWEDSKDVFLNEPSPQNAIKDELKSQIDKVIDGQVTAQEAAQNVFDFATDAFQR